MKYMNLFFQNQNEFEEAQVFKQNCKRTEKQYLVSLSLSLSLSLSHTHIASWQLGMYTSG